MAHRINMNKERYAILRTRIFIRVKKLISHFYAHVSVGKYWSSKTLSKLEVSCSLELHNLRFKLHNSHIDHTQPCAERLADQPSMTQSTSIQRQDTAGADLPPISG